MVENGEWPWGTKKKKKKCHAHNCEDLGQTSNWSKLVAAYLPVARLTILDCLVPISMLHIDFYRYVPVTVQVICNLNEF